MLFRVVYTFRDRVIWTDVIDADDEDEALMEAIDSIDFIESKIDAYVSAIMGKVKIGETMFELSEILDDEVLGAIRNAIAEKVFEIVKDEFDVEVVSSNIY